MTSRHAAHSVPELLRHEIQRWPTARSKAWTLRLLDNARRDENIVAVVAVGSAVRPDVRSADLDLIVICRQTVRLDLKPPLEIDLRAYGANDVEEQIAKGSDLLGWAVKFGRVLFQRKGYWDTIVTQWRERLPLPSSEVATQRAVEAYRRLTNVLALGDRNAAYEQAVSYVTHLARAELLRRKIYPASRPELAEQLKRAGGSHLAKRLERLLNRLAPHSKDVEDLWKAGPPMLLGQHSPTKFDRTDRTRDPEHRDELSGR